MSKCNDNLHIPINGLDKKFPNTHQFCSRNVNKFALLLRKGIYPYEYMNRWGKFNKNTIPNKEAFYSKLNWEDISDKDYNHARKVWDVFGIRNLGDYHDLYVQSDTLLLADVFENFRDNCIDIYELDPSHFLSAPGLALQAFFK